MTASRKNANALSNHFEDKHPEEILRWVAESSIPHRIGLGTGFGLAGICLIDMIVKINKEIPIFYLDTEVLFPETYALRDRLEEKYQIKFVRYATPLTMEAQKDQYGDRLWERDPNQCCNLRKVQPLNEALRNYDVWITAIRREQSPARANAGIIEWDPKFDVIKINPLATWTKSDVWNYINTYEVPYNPLHDRGYPSIGCTHCTTPVADGEDERDGRWRGQGKIECGLHMQVNGDRHEHHQPQEIEAARQKVAQR